MNTCKLMKICKIDNLNKKQLEIFSKYNKTQNIIFGTEIALVLLIGILRSTVSELMLSIVILILLCIEGYNRLLIKDKILKNKGDTRR